MSSLDLADLEARFNAMIDPEQAGPLPWSIKPNERGPHGNDPSYVIDGQGRWVATTDVGSTEEWIVAITNAFPGLLAKLRERTE